MKFLIKITIYLIVFLLILVSVRGVHGNPTKENINSDYWIEKGPFELSPERGRFALTYSLVEDKSFQFDLPVARFTIPDLGYIDGKYVSLFAPGVSFLIIPGYLIGQVFGVSQLGSYAVISFFALLNVLLIEAIAVKLGARKLCAIVASLAFVFATPAFTYAVSLYQHHVSVFLLLAGIYIYLNYKCAFSTGLIWFLVALSIPVDFPNFFMMIPLMVLAVLRFFEVSKTNELLQIKFKYTNLSAIIGVVLPLLFLGWVNYKTYSDPLRLAGTVENIREIDENGSPVRDSPQGVTKLEQYRVGERESNSVALGFFDSRNISNGLYIHFFSPDRGILLYAPIVFFSVVGGYILYKKNSKVLALLLAISLINIFTYSMWGDPWGGWAFGSRYLIPLYAVTSILLSFALEKILKSKLLKFTFLIILIYSVFVNTLGALTSSLNPPKVEVLQLEELSDREEKYTFMRNWDYLNNTGSKSFFYGKYLSDFLTPIEFYLFMAFSFSFLLSGLVFYDIYARKFKKFTVKEVGLSQRGIESILIDSSNTSFKSHIMRFISNFNFFRKDVS